MFPRHRNLKIIAARLKNKNKECLLSHCTSTFSLVSWGSGETFFHLFLPGLPPRKGLVVCYVLKSSDLDLRPLWILFHTVYGRLQLFAQGVSAEADVGSFFKMADHDYSFLTFFQLTFVPQTSWCRAPKITVGSAAFHYAPSLEHVNDLKTYFVGRERAGNLLDSLQIRDWLQSCDSTEKTQLTLKFKVMFYAVTKRF